MRRDLLGRPGRHDLAASVAALWPEIDRCQSAVLITSRLCSITTIVLPVSTRRGQHLKQLRHIREVQARGRLVQDVDRLAGRAARQLASPA